MIFAGKFTAFSQIAFDAFFMDLVTAGGHHEEGFISSEEEFVEDICVFDLADVVEGAFAV